MCSNVYVRSCDTQPTKSFKWLYLICDFCQYVTASFLFFYFISSPLSCYALIGLFKHNSSDSVRMEWWSRCKTVSKCCVCVFNLCSRMEMIEHILRKSHTISKSGFKCCSEKASIEWTRRKKTQTNGKFRSCNHEIEKCFEQEALVLLLLCIQCHSMWIMRSIERWLFEYVNTLCIRMWSYGGWDMIADAITNLLKSMKTNKIIHSAKLTK